MFSEHIKSAILALACTDAGATEEEKNRLQSALSGSRNERTCAVLNYRMAAEVLRLSVPTVKKMASNGMFTKAYTCKDGKRACGITRQSIEDYITKGN